MDYGQAQQELQQILSGAEYRVYEIDYRAPFWQTLLKNALTWLGEQWAKLFPAHAGLTDALSYFSLLVLAVLIFVFIFIAARMLIQIPSGVRWRERLAGAAGAAAPTPAAYLAEAERWAEQRNYGQAVRALFLSLLLFLDGKGWIEAKAWKTNGDYVAELRFRNAEAVEAFAYLAANFEETAYGGRPLDPDIYRLCLDRVNRWIGKEDAL